MGIFDAPVAAMLKSAGEKWTTTIKGSSVSLYGIFDAENRIEDDGTGMAVIRDGSVLTCLYSIAKDFTLPSQTLVSPDGTEWRVKERLKIEDGVLSRCTLVEVPE